MPAIASSIPAIAAAMPAIAAAMPASGSITGRSTYHEDCNDSQCCPKKLFHVGLLSKAHVSPLKLYNSLQFPGGKNPYGQGFLNFVESVADEQVPATAADNSDRFPFDSLTV
jgi:hypothetical protein